MNKRYRLLAALLCLAACSSPWSFAQDKFQALENDIQPLEAKVPTLENHDEHHVSRGEKIARWMEDHGLGRSMAIAAISTLPIVELRGAVPVGIVAFEMPWWKVFIISVAGNMIPIPFILLLLGPVSKFLMRFKLGKRFFECLFARTRRKSANIEKYEALGLTVFVAIPLPVTGGWTGAMAAFLMGTPFWQAMLCILLGVMIAGVI
ncbi:MAG: small multi-drug export protein, partial [Kiritimatiellales bacterium]|nr:small multi-drug export protein [Kiritimatiellales bacterium]